MRTLVGWLLLMVCLILPKGVLAQEDEASPTTVRITLTDGSVFLGSIEHEDESTIVFVTESGVRMEIPRDQVRAIDVQDEIGSRRFSRLDPNRTRLLFAPTARSLGGGVGYAAVYEIFFPFAAIGVNDAIMLGGGFSIIPGLEEQLVYAAPKVTVFQQRHLALSAGAFVATITGEEGTGGVLYGVGTVGPSEKALTLGLGFAFGGGEFEETPALLIGGEFQVSNRVKLITENYVLPGIEDGLILSGGLRVFAEHLAVDFGFFTAPAAFQEGGFPFVPWLGFVYNFGH